MEGLTEDQQQHSSSLQFGQSLAEGALRHSSGEHPQSAQRIISFIEIDGAEFGTALNTKHQQSRATMIFVTLYKFRHKLTKSDIDQANKTFAGAKTIGVWWTLGRFDAIRVFEAKDEKDAMKMNLALEEGASTETMVAVDRAEALKLL